MSTKPSNPKDAIGGSKLPLELVPDVIRAYASLAFLEGATKYGRFNWRVAGVRASIYKAALERHLMKWWNGEDADPLTGVPHLASVIACVGIILDAQTSEKLTDDRPPYQNIGDVIEDLEHRVALLKKINADKSPKQYTLADGDPVPLAYRGIKITEYPMPAGRPMILTGEEREALRVEMRTGHDGNYAVDKCASAQSNGMKAAGQALARDAESGLYKDRAPSQEEAAPPEPRCTWCDATVDDLHAVGCPGSLDS